MNKIILYKGIYKCFDYTFDNLTDLLSYIETAPVNENKFLRRASEEGSKSFTGTSSLKESINLCRSGWNEGFDDFLLKKEKLDRKFPWC